MTRGTAAGRVKTDMQPGQEEKQPSDQKKGALMVIHVSRRRRLYLQSSGLLFVSVAKAQYVSRVQRLLLVQLTAFERADRYR